MSISKDIRIAVIGGGLSGFAVATMLIKQGFKQVIVYERDISIDQRRQGYGLTILQGIAALKALNCFEQVKAVDTPSRSHYIFDSQGNIVNFFGTIFWSQQRPEATTSKSNKKYNLHIGRTNLRRIIYEELLRNGGQVNWNYRIRTVKETADSLLVEFSNGVATDVDLVIGADGIKSVVRSFKYEPVKVDYPLSYLGMVMVLGITFVGHSLAQQRVFQTVDGSTRLFAMPYAR